jgi:hypothetical protein
MGEMTGLGLFTSFLVGTIGFSVFLYGKKQQRLPHLIGGLLLMAFPYFVANTAAILGIAGLIVGGTWVATRRGH